MGITIDNAIIDFNTINNIVTTLNTHQDTFTAFENQSLITSTIDNSANPINITAAQIATVKVQVKVGEQTPIPYGQVFSAPPIVTASVEYKSTSTALIAQIISSSSTSGSTTSYDSCSIMVVDASANGAKTKGTTVTVHLMAIGQR